MTKTSNVDSGSRRFDSLTFEGRWDVDVRSVEEVFRSCGIAPFLCDLLHRARYQNTRTGTSIASDRWYSKERPLGVPSSVELRCSPYVLVYLKWYRIITMRHRLIYDKRNRKAHSQSLIHSRHLTVRIHFRSWGRKVLVIRESPEANEREPRDKSLKISSITSWNWIGFSMKKKCAPLWMI